MPLSHADAIRRVQLEDALRDVRHRIAVYYDQNGLDADAKAAKLDISRVPVRHRTGIFHAKSVFALVEDLEADDEGERALSLIVAGTSANLTRAGWWENVEVCHAEKIESGESIGFRDDLIGTWRGSSAGLEPRLPTGTNRWRRSWSSFGRQNRGLVERLVVGWRLASLTAAAHSWIS